MKVLGRLERVDLRTAWQSEAIDFTPWLAQADNLAILSDTIGRELELEAQERNVGPFRADILCKDVENGQWVLVENQLERTDHGHLGQLLTYAAGLQAVTIVWVAARFTEEHRATLDWLNEITDERFEFFGLEVELWRIGDSAPAPKFNIVSKPNDWSRDVGQAAKRIETEALTETKQKQLAFWTMFREYLQAEGSSMRAQKPLPQHWANFKIGRSGFVLAATLNSRLNRVGVELYINSSDPKADFKRLLAQKETVESDYGCDLRWMELPERKGAAIGLYRDGIAPLAEDNWVEIAQWLRLNLERFDAVFRKRIRELGPELAVNATDDIGVTASAAGHE
jgi:hypothetical protein